MKFLLQLECIELSFLLLLILLGARWAAKVGSMLAYMTINGATNEKSRQYMCKKCEITEIHGSNKLGNQDNTRGDKMEIATIHGATKWKSQYKRQQMGKHNDTGSNKWRKLNNVQGNKWEIMTIHGVTNGKLQQYMGQQMGKYNNTWGNKWEITTIYRATNGKLQQYMGQQKGNQTILYME